MTIKNLVRQYQQISQVLNKKWPLKNHDQRVFARTMKIVEELGELSDEILTSMNLQRHSKIQKFSQKNVDDEFADVLGSLVLLGIELDIDVVEVMERKLQLTRERFEITKEDLREVAA
jgi:NTP pyrophosphatase (non-canonical NTP hydrolase)